MLSTQREDLSVIPKYPHEKPGLAVLVILELGGGTDRRIPWVSGDRKEDSWGREQIGGSGGGYRQEDPWSGYQQEDPWGEERTDGILEGESRQENAWEGQTGGPMGERTDRRIPGVYWSA